MELESFSVGLQKHRVLHDIHVLTEGLFFCQNLTSRMGCIFQACSFLTGTHSYSYVAAIDTQGFFLCLSHLSSPHVINKVGANETASTLARGKVCLSFVAEENNNIVDE